MARLVGPDEGSRLAYVLRGDNSLGSAAGLPAAASPFLKAALRRQHSRRASLVRIGG